MLAGSTSPIHGWNLRRRQSKRASDRLAHTLETPPSSGFARYAANSAWLIFERLGSALISVLVTAVVARFLGPADFGKLAYALSMATIFAIIGHIGLDTLVVRELRSEPSKANVTLGTVMMLKFGAHGIAAALLLVFVFVAPGHDGVDHGLFAFAAVFTALSALNTLAVWFHARIEGRIVSLSTLAGSLTSSAFKATLVLLGASVLWFAAANVIFIVVTALFLYVALYRSAAPDISQWRFSSETARRLLTEGSVVFVAAILSVIYLKIDVAMLRWLAEPQAVGSYAVAAQLSQATSIVAVAITTSVFPKLVELKNGDPTNYIFRIQQVYDTLFLSSIAVLAAVYFFGGFFIGALFGAAFSGSHFILLIHMLAAPFIFMQQAFNRWALIERISIYLVFSHGIGAILNVSLNLTLIPYMAGQGAAIATVVSYVGAAFISLVVWSRTRPAFFAMCRSMFTPWNAATRVLAAFRGR